jgi:alanine racemase
MESPRCWLEISRSAFSKNVVHAKNSLAQGSRLMVAVKSNAYGHGGGELAAVAMDSGADALAVLDVETGVSIRQVVPDASLLCWLLSPRSDFQAAIDSELTLGISHLWQLDLVEGCDTPTPVAVHLKVDTGLHRNGCVIEHFPELTAKARKLEEAGVIQVEGMWSHLADTSIAEDRKSLDRFHQAVGIAKKAGLSPTILHIAASAAATDLPESRLDLVRIGISVYGVSPFDDRTAEDMGFTPVMVAQTTVVESFPDGRTTLGMGYADGLLPLPAGVGWLHHDGALGRIDSVSPHALSVTWPAGSEPQAGDAITLFGDPAGGSPRAEDWASWAGTIGDEVVAAMPGEVHRIFVD